MQQHYHKLEQMYLHAPLHAFYNTLTIKIEHSKSAITLLCDKKYFHAAGSLHGSVLFKLLDDAAFFAAQSLVHDVFLLTSDFNIQFARPVNKGLLTATGTVRFASKNLIVAQASVVSESGKEIAFGSGSFLKSKTLLHDVEHYKL